MPLISQNDYERIESIHWLPPIMKKQIIPVALQMIDNVRDLLLPLYPVFPFYVDTDASSYVLMEYATAASVHLFATKKLSPNDFSLKLMSSIAYFAHCSQYIGALCHEIGHAAISRLFFVNTPKVEIFYLGKGITTYWTHQETWLTKAIGKSSAIAITTAAGPIASLLFSSITLQIGLYRYKNNQESAMEYIGTGIGSSASLFSYAITGFYSEEASNDFTNLKQAGIPPIVPAIISIVIPTVIILGNILYNWTSFKKSLSEMV